MSLNWIHNLVYAPQPILEELKTALEPHVHKADDLSINTDKDGKPYLFTDTWEEDALDKIVSNLHNGEIMLLHGTSKTNADIMSEMIKRVREVGYEFKSLDEF